MAKKNLVKLDTKTTRVERKRRVVLPEQVASHLPQIIFISAAVVVVLVIMIMSGISTITQDILIRPGTVSSKVESEAIVLDEKDSLSVLIAKTETDSTGVQMFILMRIDPAENKVYLTTFDSQLVISETGETMAERYRLGGASQCAKDMQKYFGAREIYSASVNYTTMKQLVNSLGGVELTVPYDINYQSEDVDKNIIVAKGTRTFAGGEVSRLLECPEWPGGEEERRLMHARTFASLANSTFVLNKSGRLESYYNKIFNSITTDVSAGVFQDMLPGFYEWACSREDDSEDISTIVLAETETVDGELYLTEYALKVMKFIYGARSAE